MKNVLKKMRTMVAFIIVLGGTTTTYSQSYSSTFDFGVGVTQNGIAALAGLNFYTNQHDFFQTSIYGSFAEHKYKEGIKIPYSDISMNVGFFKNLYYNKQNTIKLNVGLGALFGYESINTDKYLPNGGIVQSKDHFVYGGFLGADLDILLTDNYSLTLKANEYYHANSTIGNFTPYVGVGIRCFLN